MKFDLDSYEPVEDRIKRFYADHPKGRIITILHSTPDNQDYAVFEAQVYDNDNVMRATGWAQEFRDIELSKTKDGRDYESVNFSAWLENAETSAIGRALANFNYSGSKRPSREEMQKVQRSENVRPANMTCPECGKPKIIKSKYGPEWYCLACKAKFGQDDPRVTVQFVPTDVVENPKADDVKETDDLPF